MGSLRTFLLTACVLAATTSCVSEPTPRASAPRPEATVVQPAIAKPAPAPQPDLLALLSAAAPDANKGMLSQALRARECALAYGDIAGDSRLAVIDYSLPSTQPRLWVFDLQQKRLLYREHVAHGRNSGHNMTTSFSNVDGSHQSSLGLFRTAETYVGGNGYSMRMDGLERGVNDNARDRLIVMHGADYVDPQRAKAQGRLGRSFGCPALRQAVAREVIDVLKGGQLLFAWYPEDRWLTQSRFLNCDPRLVASRISTAGVNPAGSLHTAAR